MCFTEYHSRYLLVFIHSLTLFQIPLYNSRGLEGAMHKVFMRLSGMSCHPWPSALGHFTRRLALKEGGGVGNPRKYIRYFEMFL